MNKAIPFVALLLSGAAFANSSGSSASASGTVLQSTQQNNLIGEVIHPYATVGENYASCATNSASIGVVGNYNDSFGDIHSHGFSVGGTYNWVMDTNGANYRCSKQQANLIRLKEIQIDRLEYTKKRDAVELEIRQYEYCKRLDNEGVRLDHLHPMAGKCSYYHNVKLMSAFQK